MKILKRTLIAILLLVLTISILGIGYFLIQVDYVKNNPINIQANNKILHATCIYDRNGNLVQKLGSNMAKSEYTEDIPDLVKKALISIEDKRFYTHKGVDTKRTLSAIANYILNFGDSDYGGSTITQQLVKNVSGNNGRNITRKVREWLYAIDVEKKHDKDFIITQYLNIVYFGNGIYGIKDAAQYYFDKEVNQLTINEAAFLVGIVQMPETYIRDEELANERKNTVLSCMYEQGYISKEEFASNIEKYITIQNKICNQQVQSYFVDSIIVKLSDVLSKKYNISKEEATKMIYQNGYKIYSTLDSDIQQEMDDIYNNIEDIQSSIVIMSNDGKVVAIRGGTGEKKANMVLNRALSSKRQPGSAFKPIAVYAPAIEEGIITKESIVCDKSITYGNWSPHNWYTGYRGEITVRKALEISCNTVAVQILDELGIDKSIEFLEQIGFKLDKNDRNLSMALGGLTYGATALEMASGYQTLANNGIYLEPIFFEVVLDNQGNEIYNYKEEQKEKRIFSEETANAMSDLLTTVVTGYEGTARSFKLDRFRSAAKTGTTTNDNDKWFCAYTPYYTVATWYGHDAPRTVQYSSSQIQKNTKAILDKLHENLEYKEFNLPKEQDMELLQVCAITKLIPTELCTNIEEIYVEKGTILSYCEKCKVKENEEKSNNESLEEKEEIILEKEEEISNVENNAEEISEELDINIQPPQREVFSNAELSSNQ